MREAPLEEARRWLRAIHGIGPFTSGLVLFRAVGRFDGATMIPPLLLAAAEKVYGRAMAERDVRRTCERYGAWGGHWMLYLWASTFV